MRYIHFGLVLVSVYLPNIVWALPVLATIQLFFAIIFYWLVFGLLSGLKSSGINPEMDTSTTWTSRVIQTGASSVLFMTWDPYYQAIAIFTLPWIVTTIATDVLATLMKWEILDITSNEDEE